MILIADLLISKTFDFELFCVQFKVFNCHDTRNFISLYKHQISTERSDEKKSDLNVQLIYT